MNKLTSLELQEHEERVNRHMMIFPLHKKNDVHIQMIRLHHPKLYNNIKDKLSKSLTEEKLLAVIKGDI